MISNYMCKRFRHTMKPMIKTLAQTMQLSRDDVIDIVGKIDGIDKNIQLVAEDIITDGSIRVKLMVRTISEFNDVDYDEQYVSLTITNGVISEYIGTDTFPSATMDDSSTQITILNPQHVQVTGITIKENTLIRHLDSQICELYFIKK